jgi:hypothetical protein
MDEVARVRSSRRVRDAGEVSDRQSPSLPFEDRIEVDNENLGSPLGRRQEPEVHEPEPIEPPELASAEPLVDRDRATLGAADPEEQPEIGIEGERQPAPATRPRHSIAWTEPSDPAVTTL